jgi:NADH:ubiquinone oxidoreductase subunit
MAQRRMVPYMGGMTIGTRIFTYFHGRLLGKDPAGNRYFEEKKVRPGARARRWVLYAGPAEASAVPAEWHSWLHYTTDTPLPETARKPWQLPHQENLTGTAGGYRPPGHDYSGGNRPKSTGDYESWTPGS